jgi:hypothetical protein
MVDQCGFTVTERGIRAVCSLEVGHPGDHEDRSTGVAVHWPGEVGEALEAIRTMVPHPPGRPHWRCRTCGSEWPCDPAKAALLATYGRFRRDLAGYLGVMMMEAYEDFASLNPNPADRMPTGAMLRRFVGWARSDRTTQGT